MTFGIPIIFQVVMMGPMFAHTGYEPGDGSTLMHNHLWFFPVMMIIFTAAHYGWKWSIAIGLQTRVPEDVAMKVNKFKIFFVILLVYIFLLTILIGASMSGMWNGADDNIGRFIGSFVVIIIPLHLFSMLCIFYVLYFVAKTFKTVELQRAAYFSDFAGEFFMIWFYPIGIWIIQPKVNKMIE